MLEGASFAHVAEQPFSFLFGQIFLRLKREMTTLEETMRLWEVSWASGPHFHVLILAAFVLLQRRAILRLRSGNSELHHLFGKLHETQRAAPLLAVARQLQQRPGLMKAVEEEMTAEIIARSSDRALSA